MAGAYRPPSTSTAQRWGTYSRISDDPHDTQRGVTRQQADNRQAVEARGHVVAREYVENDTSAYRKRRIERTDDRGGTYQVYRTIRPVWQEALADLRAGVVDGLMVWDLDRLARDPRDLEDAIEVVEHHGRRIEGESGSIDLATDSGRAMARVLMAMNNKSSADTGRRVARAAFDSAQRGTAAGKRSFGWNDDKRTLHPTEAPLARQAAEDVIRGARPLGAIATAWNEAGAFTAHYGKPWTNGSVRQYLRNPRLAGFRTYRREILLNDDGKPVMGVWEPLITAEKWEQLQAALGSRSVATRHRVPHRNARHYLLTGLLVCGVCSGLMYGNRDGRRGIHYYRCIRVRYGEGKHTLTIAGPATDELVTLLTEARLARLEPVEATPAAFPEAGELERTEGKIKELMDAYGRDEMPGSIVFPRVREALDAALAPMRARERAWRGAAAAPEVRELADMFASADVGVKRTALESIYECIVVKPVSVRALGFNPERIEPVWKGDTQ